MNVNVNMVEALADYPLSKVAVYVYSGHYITNNEKMRQYIYNGLLNPLRVDPEGFLADPAALYCDAVPGSGTGKIVGVYTPDSSGRVNVTLDEGQYYLFVTAVDLNVSAETEEYYDAKYAYGWRYTYGQNTSVDLIGEDALVDFTLGTVSED